MKHKFIVSKSRPWWDGFATLDTLTEVAKLKRVWPKARVYELIPVKDEIIKAKRSK